MNILVGNNQLEKTGGSENYTYALATTLKAMGHDVEYFTFHKGMVTDRLEKQGIHEMSHNHYDLILANHTPVIEKLFACGYTIQTCHGTIMGLEQPSPYADSYVSVTEEVKEHLEKYGLKSEVILNGIDCKRFRPTRELSRQLTKVLSLCQSDAANNFIRECCNEIGAELSVRNKFTDNVWEIEQSINEADLVIGIGRSLYDAMACGRCVISFDKRDYMNLAIGDGYITKDNIENSIKRNCSGRSSGRTFSKEEFVSELRKYNPKDGEWARQYALSFLNMEVSAKRYIAIYKKACSSGYDTNRSAICKIKILMDANHDRFKKTIQDHVSENENETKHIINQLVGICNSLDEAHRSIGILFDNYNKIYHKLQEADKKKNEYLRTIKLMAYIGCMLLILLITIQICTI